MLLKSSRRPACSSVEVLLSTMTVVLFVVCVGLVVVSWLTLHPGNEGQTGSSSSWFGGTLTISEGVSFTEELRNRSSVHFKALAFDTELLISEVYALSSLKAQFRSCRVNDFSPGSVIVHFTLLFEDVVEVTAVQQQLISGLQNIPDSTLVINSSSVHLTEVSTTQIPPTTAPEPVKCPDGQRLCRDDVTCVPINWFCNGEPNCPDASDESHSTCATVCDGQFLLLGPSGFFHSQNFPLDYESGTVCRWIICVNEGLNIRIDLETFDTEQEIDLLNLYEGTGDAKSLAYSLSGSSPGVVWIFSHEATVEFSSNFINNRRGFNATYRAENLTHLSNEMKINCSFEDGFCFWRHDAGDDGDWIRKKGSSLPALTGPSFDHTFANQSGYYIITPFSPRNWEKIFRLRSLPLTSTAEPVCLRFCGVGVFLCEVSHVWRGRLASDGEHGERLKPHTPLPERGKPWKQLELRTNNPEPHDRSNGKGRELADVMERRKVDILCVQETRWKGSKARSIGAGFKLFYYGVDSKRNGVGVVLKEEFVRNVLEVKRVSDRVMSLKLEIEGVMLNVVSGYAPQVGCELEEKERFWSELDEVMESIPTGERVVIGADFNGHVGEGNTGDEEVMGKFGVKERSLEGQMLRGWTWKLRQALGGQVVLPDDWETTAEVIRETGRKVLGVSSGRRKEDKETWWWNEEVQDSVQRKRLAKKKWDMDRTEENRQEYKELQRRVKREVSKAKQKAYDELYTRLDTREGQKDLYRLARQRDRDGKDVQQVRVIKDRDGRVLTSEESVQRRWKEYFEELMNEENEREKRVEGVNSVEQEVDKIRKDEVRKALKRMKSGKAVGPDDIPVEVWKCLGEAAVEFLTSLFNRVLESERMPEEWRRSVLVPIFKNKGDVQSCSNYRGIKLMSHTMKLWERVVEARLRNVVEICEQQYGFMPRKSTTDAIFALRILMEKYRDGQRELHCVFVDLEKAYDRVPREELWYCMRKSGVAKKYVRVVQDMYERSRTVVRCAVGQTEEFKVEVGLHQGSALSPFLFAIVMDQLSEEVRQESPWTMMFADDIVICSESREQVEENLERWRFALERRGMKVSGSKTEYMCVNEREGSGTVRLQGEEVKKVQEFKYLGSTVQSNGECGKEVKKRVQAGWNGWRKVWGVLCERKISVRIKGKVYRTVVRAAMLYGLETVSLRKRQESELEIVFEARKRGGLRSNIALDDLSMTSGPCGPLAPDPTTVPLTPTPTPVPADCGGPFDLYESNSTFSSPNYPHGYRHSAACVWILHAKPGQNIQLHFQDFSLETGYDVLEIRDGVEPHSTLLNVLSGKREFPDLFSTTSEMTLLFFSDSSGSDRGFLANFSTGFNLGQPEACQDGEYRCRSGMCVSGDSVCDGIRNCPDASDETHCVSVAASLVPGAPRLKIEVQRLLYTACSSLWSSHCSLYFCRYLGYRSGNASFVSAVGEDAPFAIVTQTVGGSVSVKPSDKCPSEKVVSLHCDNQSCGRRKVIMSREWRGKMEEESSEGVAGRIVGGEDAVKGAWPWITSLRWTGRSICGATLIDSRWLVTAAHCVYGKSIHLSNWNVVLGLHDQYESNTSDRQYHQIQQIIMNPNYNKRTKDSDIALILLQNKVNFTDYIQPICFPESQQQFAAGRKCAIAGWGRLTEGGLVADVLQQAVVPLINNSVCQERLPEYNITERMVCAGYPEGGIDTCQGDSGGPLMCEEEDGLWVLAGVTSFGMGCARPGRPGVYALLTHFTEWILETRRLYSHWDGAR
ncbi:hypothetical protein QTP86_021783 [Hemibagrus guttatus]|nr:hypothetical protein QTP86_021783 [Hemibagrus guttatus]